MFSIHSTSGRITSNQAFPVRLRSHIIVLEVSDMVHQPEISVLTIHSDPRTLLSKPNKSTGRSGFRRNLWIAVGVGVVSTVAVVALLAAIGVERRAQRNRKSSDNADGGSRPLKALRTVSNNDRYNGSVICTIYDLNGTT